MTGHQRAEQGRCQTCGNPTPGPRYKFCAPCLHARRKEQWNAVAERKRQGKVCPDCKGTVPKGAHYCKPCAKLRRASDSRSRKPAAQPTKPGYVMVECGRAGTIFGIKLAEMMLDEERCAIVRLITTKSEVAFPVACCVPITTAQLLKFSVGGAVS